MPPPSVLDRLKSWVRHLHDLVCRTCKGYENNRKCWGVDLFSDYRVLVQNWSFSFVNEKYKETRLHSSRMHTARLLTVSPSLHCTGGGLVRGDVCSRGVPGPGGVCFGGCLLWGVPGPQEGCGIPACTEADPPCEQNSWHTPLKIQGVKFLFFPIFSYFSQHTPIFPIF